MRIMRVRLARRRANQTAATANTTRMAAARDVDSMFDEDLASLGEWPEPDGPGDSTEAMAAMGASGCAVFSDVSTFGGATAGLAAITCGGCAIFAGTVGAAAPMGSFLSGIPMAAAGCPSLGPSSAPISARFASGGKVSAARRVSFSAFMRASAASGASGRGFPECSVSCTRTGGAPLGSPWSRQNARTRIPEGVGSTVSGDPQRASVEIPNLV